MRLFLALWPGPATRAALAAWQKSVTWPVAARLVRPENLHSTLHFIGAVPVDRIAEVQAELAVPAGRASMILSRLEVWKGGIAVLTPAALPLSLVELHARLADRLQALGLPVEYPTWRAHVTLARAAAGVEMGDAPSVAWRSEGYALVQSAGGAYRVLQRYR